MTVLLDPQVLLPPPSISSVDQLLEHWEQVVDWSSDRRIVIGGQSYDLVLMGMESYDYPNNNPVLEGIPNADIFLGALNRLLGRVRPGESAGSPKAFEPEYAGDEICGIALAMDVSCFPDSYAIASCLDCWGELENDTIRVTPSPPRELEVFFEPNKELRTERSLRIKKYYSDKRIHIVGGAEDTGIKNQIINQLGVLEKNISWDGSELKQRPRDIEKRWHELRPERDIVVCLTGRIGHATSIVAEVAAKKQNVVYLEARKSSNIIDALIENAMSEGSS